MLKAWKKPFLPLITRLGKSREARLFSEAPILIGGCGRSGTTLLLSMLSAHKDLFAIPKELGLFNGVERGPEGRLQSARIDRLYFSLLRYSIPASAKRWCEKSPSNVTQIQAIDEHFKGRFKLIHIVRDGRDVVLSIHPTDKTKYWVEPSRWVHDVQKGLDFIDHPNVHTIKYEDLLLNYTTVMEGITQYLNSVCSIGAYCGEVFFLPAIPPEELQQWLEHATVRRNRAYFSEVGKIQTKSIGKWKCTKDQQRVEQLYAEPGALELLQRLGYEVPDDHSIKE